MLITGRDLTFAVMIQLILELVLFAYLYYRYIFQRNNDNLWALIFKSLFYLYIIGVLFVTLLPLDFQYFKINTVYAQHSNLFHPFEDLLLNRSNALKALALNIIMFMPFGFLVPIITKYSFIKTLITIFIATLSIELLQVLLSCFNIGFRVFDITDIITNCLGGIIGFIVFWLFKCLFKNKIAYLNSK